MFGVPLAKLQHTYIVDGDEEEIGEILKYLEREGIKTISNPSVIVERHQQFGIEESRTLKEKCVLAVLERQAFYILGARSLTREAEQSLLKLLEEPTQGLHLFLVTPYTDQLLETLRSRAQVVSRTRGKTSQVSFLKKTIPSRLGEVRTLLKSGETDEEVSQITHKALEFIERVEYELREQMNTKKEYGLASYLENLLSLKRHLHLRGSSTKMILEHIALTLPQL